MSDRRVVLGIGNTLNRDEGFGVHAARALQSLVGDKEGVEFIDGGTLGLSLLPVVEGCTHLLILDAVNAGRLPGTVVELRGNEIPVFRDIKMSQHQVTFQEVLGLASLRGQLPPHLHLIGVQPADLSVGLGLSKRTEAVMEMVLRKAQDVLRTWQSAG